MKKLNLLLTVAALLLVTAVSAQVPANDECATAIPLNAPDCQPTIYTNVNATTSVIGTDNNPTCFNGGNPSNDVWFSFTCPDTLTDLRLTLTGTGGTTGIDNPQVAIYRGECTFNDLAEYLCIKADVGETSIILDMPGLTPGFTYYIRVSDYSQTATPNWGEFTLCVDKIPPVVTIDEGGSTLCEGTIADSGGADGDYGPGENHVFTICPNTPSACILFSLDYFNLDYGGPGFAGSDVLSIYDGNNTSGTLLASINGQGFSQEDISGGGGVCFQTQATSGCLTLAFTSDGFTEFEGFLGHWACSNLPCPAPEQLTVNNFISNEEIVNSVATPATTVTISSIVCDDLAYGTFSFPTASNDLAMSKGLVLSSGEAGDTPGFGAAFASSIMNTPGDQDLDYLSALQNGEESFDACVVELDVFVATDELSFEYVFGSEEYPEYVNSLGGFNDIFAFLVSGPGIVGDPGLGGQKNIAVLPGSNTPVEINSVNNGVNWEYYRNNEIGQEVVFDGLTTDYLGVKKTLTARTAVQPCQTYHLKLAVADRGDASFDSGVFVSEIKGATPNIKVQFASGIDYFIEDCSGTQDQLVISLSEAPTEVLSFITTVSGSATLGLDYTLNIPSIITFQPGETELFFPIVPLADGLIEGTETINITLSNNFGCGTVIYKTITIEIKDDVVVDVNAGSDTLLVCAGTTFQLQAAGATSYFWQPAGAVSNPNIDNPTITPTVDQWLQVTGSIATCVDVDSVYIKIVAPAITLIALTDSTICQGQSVQLLAANNVNNIGLTWSPTVGLSSTTTEQPIATPTVTTTYTASVTVSGCTVSDQVIISVDTLFFPKITTLDTTICQNYSVKLGTDIKNSTTVFTWTPALGLSDPTVSGPVATPDQTTTYTLTAVSPNGSCLQTAAVKVTVIAADIDIPGDTYREICLGTTVNLQANIAPASAAQVNWSPSFYVSNPTGPTTNATPDETVTIKATYNVNGCVVVDSVRIRVDSLPDLILGLRPVKPIYCPGDTVTLLSTTYEPANFPDINNLWLDGPGKITPDSNWNMVIRADSSFFYQRITTNRACKDTAGIFVPVGKIPVLIVTADRDKICPGETVLLNVTVDPAQKVEWDAGGAPISCTDCLSPTVNPTSTTTYSVSTPDADCPAAASITIQVLPPPALALTPPSTICLGSDILLNNVSVDPNTTYLWTSEPVGFTSTAANPSVTPTQNTTYTVVASNGCTSTGTVVINVVDAQLTASNDTTVCKGVPVTLVANGTGTGTYTWSTGANGPTTTFNADASGVYTVVYTYGNNCIKTESVNITVSGEAVALSVPQAPGICPGGSVVLNSAAIVPGATYIWTATPADPTLNATSGAPTVSPTQNTTYQVTATLGQCVTTATVAVTAFNATLGISDDLAICAGQSVTVTATGSIPGSFLWAPTGSVTASVTETPLATTTYTVVYTYGNNCVLTDEVTVTVKPPVVLLGITANPDDFPVCSGEPVTLKASYTGGGANVFTWSQNGQVIAGQTKDSILVTPVTSLDDPQPFTFTVSVASGNGCADGPKDITITAKKCFAIPNAFTPDGDMINDTFGVVQFSEGTVIIASFEIFNRWGQQVFKADAAKPRWDGKVDGKEAPVDVYIYKIVVANIDGTTETFTDQVNLIR